MKNNSSGRYHVGFLVGEYKNGYVLLGGNQPDAVRYSKYSKETWQFVGFIYPKGYKKYEFQNTLPRKR